MPSSATRKGLWALAAGLAVVALIAAALPLVASTQIVRDRIAHEMSAWSGFRVQLGEAPDIRIWPFRAILHDVTLTEWSDEDGPPVVRAERVEIDLSAMSALRGGVVFSQARFIRPVLRLVEGEDGSYLPVLPNTGRIVRAIEMGREAMAANPSQPDLAALPADGFGSVEFSDGRIVISQDGRESELITSATGAATWPALNRAGTISASGIWRGEAIRLDISSPQPLVLLAGGAAALTFGLKAAPLQASFDGSASLSQGFLDGAAALSSPSLRRALEWSRMHIAPGTAIGAVTLEARVTGTGSRFNFQDMKLSLGGNPGIGVLDLSIAGGIPGISGTLAFERLDLQSFVSAFTARPQASGAGPGEIDISFTDQINLDLRLSAANATAGPIALTDVAATAQVKSGLAVFDISDATAFAGTIQAGFRLDRKLGGNHAEVRMVANGVDSAALAAAAGATRLVPQGAATISAMLKGPITGWNSLVNATEGSLSVKLQNGSVAGIALPALIQRAAEGGFFPLFSEGSLPLQQAELAATLSKGVAMIQKAGATTPHGTISLQGIVPYIGRGLALSGTITPDAASGAGGEEISFFIGGPWSGPFVSPIIPELPDQRW